MGQGTVTSLSMLLAEELECDWTKIRTEFPGVDRAFGGSQGRLRQPEHPLVVDAAAAGGRVGASDARAGGGARWGVDAAACRADNGVVINTATNARLSYGALAEDAAKLPVPAAPALKNPQRLPSHRHFREASRHAGQDRRHRDVRDRRPSAGHALCRRRALSRLRRHGDERRRRQGEDDSRRQARRPDLERRRGRRRQHVVRDGGPQGARHRVERRTERDVLERSADEDVRRSRHPAGRGGAQGRRRERGARERREKDRRGVRGPVPRARADGAAQLHGGRARGRLRRVGVDAGADSGAPGRAARDGLRARQDQGAHALHGRRLRAPHRA